MRYLDFPKDSTFDLALGVGERIIQFSQLFSNPKASWWKEWPDWLITDSEGKVIPIARHEFVIRGVEMGLNNFIKFVPDGMIRFNLKDVSLLRQFTLHELRYILAREDMLKRTRFYDESEELTENVLKAQLRKLEF